MLHSDPVIAASYLVGCGGKSACAVIDLVDAPERYMEMAAGLGMAIRYAIDTHVHADHHSTGRALIRAANLGHSAESA